MRPFLSLALMLALPMPAMAWGFKGHQMVNRAAVESAGPQLPEFINAGRSEVIYNAYEPDRWREEAKSPLNLAQAPDHFFDSEYFGSVLDIGPDRYQFMQKISARKLDLARIGYLPFSIIENYGRLKIAFRQFRDAKTPEDRAAARANAVFYAGLMGHYVADGAQPLHMSIHYNGWADNTPNPKGYTSDRKLHNRYEDAFVNRSIEYAEVRSRVEPPHLLKDVFESVKRYLYETFQELDQLYAMEKTGEFNPEDPHPKGRQFVTSQIARAVSMLGNMWYTAWVESSEPLPSPSPR